TKGESNMGFAAIGAFVAGAKNIIFADGVANIAGDQTGYTQKELTNHPQLLIKPQNIILADGTQVPWPGLTARTWVQLYRNVAWRPLLRSLVDFSVFDVNEDGQTITRKNYSAASEGNSLGLAGLHTTYLNKNSANA